MYGLISEDYLIHHGVKGMKWGVRHDPERKGYRPRSNQNTKSRNSFKLSKGTKIALAVTGIAAGTLVAGMLIGKGKLHADDIMKAGTKIQTLHHHPEIVTNGEKFYTTNKFLDKAKYMADFSHGGTKKKVTATVSKDIKIAGGDAGERVFEHLYRTNAEFAGNCKYSNYINFNIRGLLGKPDKSTEIFINELKKRGYDGVADLNDRRGWKTSANILFDNSKLSNIKVDNIKGREMAKAHIVNTTNNIVEQSTSQPYAAVFAVGGAGASAAGISEDKKINDRINKRK